MSKAEFNSELKNVIAKLSEFVSQDRLELFSKVIDNRTRYITVVLEDIYQPHNASAVLRTCDCFGVQDVHIIENQNQYNINPDVALGSYKWINLIRHNEKKNNTLDTIMQLKSEGYRIVATTPHENDVTLDDFDLEKGKVALFFGTELSGLSSKMLANADEFMKIPMYGFTESFNISVSASLIMRELTNGLRKSELPWQLNNHDRDVVLFKWIMNTLKRSNIVLNEYCKKQGYDLNAIKALL